jgi:hypothetical protein
MHIVGHLVPADSGKTISCLPIPLWSSLRAYTLYHVKIKKENILQLRTSITTERKVANKTQSIVENDRNQIKVGKYAKDFRN